MRRAGAARLAAAACAWPAMAHAHSFGKLYNLPVPFWMYAWGAAGALLVSFLVVGWFITRPAAAVAPASHDIGESPVRIALRRARMLRVAQWGSVAALALCIATGLFGTRNPYLNLNMTLFWIVFVLGFTYACVLAGDLYAVLNPWELLTEGLGSRVRHAFRGRRPYREHSGVWPAFAF